MNVALTSTERTQQGITAALAGKRVGPRQALLFVGPAVIASIAYMVPETTRRIFRLGLAMAIGCYGSSWRQI
jgi:hypothetical protein